ncbi:hypothetical protein NP493_853g01072 [Ridgeia piscesae]|uniref:Janus kinase and microtubule-interacting protein C-terminal domain-containing protein n=1 Tax=Ridgeia piscesae TaxID=27915 RepID=A0AAD9KM56_RIDPI|nr:hypothetical protein NP493_853g01072 [Ridgeia piscesae]
MQDLLSYSWDSETWQSPRRTNSVSSVVTPDGDTTPDVVRIMPSKEDSGSSGGSGSSGSMEKERKLQHKISELNAKVRRLDDQSTALIQDKADLVKRIKELEKGRKPLQEKNRKFLEKNMSLTVIKRNLEEKLEKLSEETAKLRCQADHNKKENQKLSDQLSFEKLERSSYEKMVRDMESLRRQAEEHEKTIEALQLACTEKDRRIELIVQRRRKQRSNKAQQKVVRFLLPARPRPGAAGIKETYYGYDDDSRSVDSELSSSSRLSSSRQSLDATIDDDGDDNVFEEFTREQYAQNYQRLAAEHLELERSFALLQAQGVHSHVDPQRETKVRKGLSVVTVLLRQDVGWLRESVLNMW